MTDESVFTQALAIGSPKERAAFLDRACADKPNLRKEVEELLAAHAASNPLDQPPDALARTGAYESDDSGPPVAAVGDTIGPYRLMEQIGEGGFGLVFVAEQSEPVRRKVALKVLKPGMDTRDVVARFEAERQALALMDHPNIARVFDAGSTAHGRPYFAMELVRGLPITEYCDGQKLSTAERLALFVKVCQAVQHAHQKGVIHRDLKPSNVLVTMIDGDAVPKVIDFGVAKAVGQSLTEKTIYTRFAQIVGTPLYMSPEQAEMSGVDVDTRADVYALGVLLYELLTGTTPFDRARFSQAGFDEMRRIIREEEPPRPSTRLSSLGETLTSVSSRRGTDPSRLAGLVRGELDWIAMRCLEKDRNRRYDSATALAKDVQRYLSGDAVEACPPTMGYRLRKAYRRNRAAVLVGGSFSLVLLAATGVSLAFGIAARRSETLAKDNASLATANEDAARRAEADAILVREKVTQSNADLKRVTDIQRRTRYAAEMNLLQAAYDAGDLSQVRTLLFDQVPRSGEDDLRGPEWHYWHRRLNGHDRMVTFDYAGPGEVPSAVRLDLVIPPVVLSPAGDRVAIVVQVRTGAVISHYVARAWDTGTGRLLGETTLDARALGLAPGEGFGVLEMPRLRFSGDGRTILFQTVVFRSRPAPGLGIGSGSELPVCYTHWDLATNQLRNRRIDAGPAPRLNRFSDDLQLAIGLRRNDIGINVFHVFRLSDGQEVFRRDWPKIHGAQLSPDGRFVVTEEASIPSALGALVPDAAVLGSRRRVICWRIGEAQPVWSREQPDWSENREYGWLTLRGAFDPGGRRYSSLGLEGGRFVARCYDVQTGGDAGSRTLCTEQQLPRLTRTWWSEPKFTERADGAQIAMPGKYGLEISGWVAGSAKQARVQCLDGPPVATAYRPDGSLVTVHMRDRTATVRTWADPCGNTDNRKDWTALGDSPYSSADGSRFLVPDPATPSRHLVLDWTGKVVTAVEGSVSLLSPDGVSLVLLRGAVADPEAPISHGVIVDLDRKEEREFFRVDPDLAFGGWAYAFNATRYLVTLHGKTAAGTPRGPVVRALLYEFPSGRLLAELTPPPDGPITHLSFSGEQIRGYSGRLRGTTREQPTWDGRTGKYLGFLPEDIRNERIAERRIRGGPLAVHHYGQFPTDGRNFGADFTVEVRDAGQDDSAPPRLTFRTSDGLGTSIHADPSPDGKRLLIIYNPDWDGQDEGLRRAVLYCTITGRPLLTLHKLPLTKRRDSMSGHWSADSQQYWMFRHQDGRLLGWDFRPLEQK